MQSIKAVITKCISLSIPKQTQKPNRLPIQWPIQTQRVLQRQSVKHFFRFSLYFSFILINAKLKQIFLQMFFIVFSVAFPFTLSAQRLGMAFDWNIISFAVWKAVSHIDLGITMAAAAAKGAERRACKLRYYVYAAFIFVSSRQSETFSHCCCCIWQTAWQELRVIAIHRGPRLRCALTMGVAVVEWKQQMNRRSYDGALGNASSNDDTSNCFARVFPARTAARCSHVCPGHIHQNAGVIHHVIHVNINITRMSPGSASVSLSLSAFRLRLLEVYSF